MYYIIVNQDFTDETQDTAKVIEFEPAPVNVSVLEVNGVEILRPKHVAPRKCTVNDILKAIGGDTDPNCDIELQSTRGDNSRLARKLGVSVRTVIEWRKKYPMIDQAMLEERENDLDWVENQARTQMASGDSKMTKWWLEAKARDRGWGHEVVRYQIPEVSNENLNRRLKELSPRERLKLLAESHNKGDYEGANGAHGGEFK